MPSSGCETCPSLMHPLNCRSSVDTAPGRRKSSPTAQNNFPTTPTHSDLKKCSSGSFHISTRTLADLTSNKLEGSCVHHGDLQGVERLGSLSEGEDVIVEETKSQIFLWNASNLNTDSEVRKAHWHTLHVHVDACTRILCMGGVEFKPQAKVGSQY